MDSAVGSLNSGFNGIRKNSLAFHMLKVKSMDKNFQKNFAHIVLGLHYAAVKAFLAEEILQRVDCMINAVRYVKQSTWARKKLAKLSTALSKALCKICASTAYRLNCKCKPNTAVINDLVYVCTFELMRGLHVCRISKDQ